MNSKRPSEGLGDRPADRSAGSGGERRPSALDHLEEDLPTTPEDIAALRRIREEQGATFSLEDVNLLNPPDGFSFPRHRRTAEGYEPFTL